MDTALMVDSAWQSLPVAARLVDPVAGPSRTSQVVTAQPTHPRHAPQLSSTSTVRASEFEESPTTVFRSGSENKLIAGNSDASDRYGSDVGGGTGEAITALTSSQPWDGARAQRAFSGSLTPDIPKIDILCTADEPIEVEDLDPDAASEEPVEATVASSAFEKHVQRTREAHDQRHNSIHLVRISNTRWEHCDNAWLDCSQSHRASRPVICSAGKGNRSQLPQAPARSKSTRELPRDREPAPSPRLTSSMTTPRNPSPLAKASTPAAILNSPRPRAPGLVASPRSRGKGTKNTRLAGNVLSRLHETPQRDVPRSQERALPKLPGTGSASTLPSAGRLEYGHSSSDLGVAAAAIQAESTENLTLEERAKKAASQAAELQVLACLARTEAVELQLAVQQREASRLVVAQEVSDQVIGQSDANGMFSGSTLESLQDQERDDL